VARMRRKPGATIPNRAWDGRPFRIFSADPGGTTGCATAEWNGLDGEELISLDQIKFNRWEMGPHDHHVELWHTLSLEQYTEIVWESFEFRQHYFKDEDGNPIAKMKVELISREYIGILRLFCDSTGTPAHHRTASSAKRFIDDEKIKQVGLWIPGSTHKMDATRHLLRYMVVVKKIQEPFTDIWLAD